MTDLAPLLASFTPDPAWSTVRGSWGPCFDAAVAFSRHLEQTHVPHRIVGLHRWARLAEHPTDALGRPMRGPHHVVVARGRVAGQEGAWSVDWCWAWSGCASGAYPETKAAVQAAVGKTNEAVASLGHALPLSTQRLAQQPQIICQRDQPLE